jgi:hypothetical protein
LNVVTIKGRHIININGSMVKLINKTGLEFVDISSERYREYIFLGKGIIKIDNPAMIAITKTGHRILDTSGKSHYIPAEWQAINWEAKKGKPHFVR